MLKSNETIPTYPNYDKIYGSSDIITLMQPPEHIIHVKVSSFIFGSSQRKNHINDELNIWYYLHWNGARMIDKIKIL